MLEVRYPSGVSSAARPHSLNKPPKPCPTFATVSSSLSVEYQQVVLIDFCSADGCFVFEATMRSMPVVLVDPWFEVFFPFG